MTFISDPKADDETSRTSVNSGARDVAKSAIKTVVPHSWIHAALRTRRTPITHAPKPVSLSMSSTEMQTLPGAVIRRFDFEWLCNALAKLPTAPPFFYTNQRGAKPSICYMQQNTKRIVEALTDVAAAYALIMSAVIDKKMTRLRTFEEVLYTVADARVSDIKLTLGHQDVNFRTEAWVIEEDIAVAPRGNIYTRKIYLGQGSGAREFLDRKGANLADLYTLPHESDFIQPIDIVYTWVNGADPTWQKLYTEHALPLLPKSESLFSTVLGSDASRTDTGESASQDIMQNPEIFDRYASRDELKYSLRSIDQFLPWVRNIVIVSNCRPPEWLNLDNPRVRWVDHSEILDAEYLPTFNSHAIESALHKVPGISRHFVYFNDDLFALLPMEPRDFFTSNGLARIRLESYGFVHGEPDPDDPDYINAARNVQTLLQNRFGKTATQLHTHTPAPIKVEVLERAEADFAEDYHRTRSNRLRDMTDISPTSFLSPHYHYLSGNAVHRDPNYRLVKRTAPYAKLFKSYLEGLRGGGSKLPALLCINDGGGSTSDDDWNAAVETFLADAFPWASQFETL